MLSVVRIVNRSRRWYGQGTTAHGLAPEDTA
jgi:hypothetical protein